MEKSITGIIIFLVSVITLVWCQPGAGRCDQATVTKYVVDNLDARCGMNLDFAFYADISSPGKDAALDAVCTENCAGRLANWLENECGGTFNATSLYYLCLQTQGTATVGRYCQYSIPPVFDADLEISSVFAACASLSQTLQCTDQCARQLQGFADQLGCCYQSLYNNTEYIQGGVDIGELAAQDVDALKILGTPFLWSACGVTPPSKCTAQSFSFPTSGCMQVLPHFQVLATLALIVSTVMGFV